MQTEELFLRRTRVLALLVLVVVTAGIALANLSTQRVTAELLDAETPERSCGWPFVWYWRSANFVPRTIEFDYQAAPDRDGMMAFRGSTSTGRRSRIIVPDRPTSE
jgi:hypothetical protein